MTCGDSKSIRKAFFSRVTDCIKFITLMLNSLHHSIMIHRVPKLMAHPFQIFQDLFIESPL